ncbi:hypothetical protein R3X27_17435 [Tropicimonas sp. TH_r6]|uniref:hypothetical protein n=1 Tax=Tropicimonas sp. TH_r6 TaxID=3082085 RepID=UPI00295495BE|nr:hypothetical protein [Tropicimonas sp. TH_r6]MDV7144463.1 hypothetical protein [Tropicimonas sp. TH_r6]
MARNEHISLTAGKWTQLTNSDVTEICVQNLSGSIVTLQATTDEIEPTSDGGGKRLMPNAILAADITLDQLWPGVSGAARVWAFCQFGSSLSVSHA